VTRRSLLVLAKEFGFPYCSRRRNTIRLKPNLRCSPPIPIKKRICFDEIQNYIIFANDLEIKKFEVEGVK
jgi:hypothetical protein